MYIIKCHWLCWQQTSYNICISILQWDFHETLLLNDSSSSEALLTTHHPAYVHQSLSIHIDLLDLELKL